ncbi:hypothetical protein [Dactylosporangium fulvum]|uniref:Uncharacterized protein n=1 Tax=Dactylosporangium fulvum TaxID=53359 RepID=A0ABY5VVJ6_9ACTN|nr:hypothetical protein [Dactylosporangium fulvum]UWP81079.1 hypothetical protein Dfulv_39095 [Dactylosporangium fulvum]
MGIIDDCLYERTPTTYAGSFLDQERGVVVVLSADTDSTRVAVSRFFDPDRIDVRAARWSLGVLQDARGMVDRSLRGKAGYIATRVDVPDNGLVVELHDSPDGHTLASQEPLHSREIPVEDGLALDVRFSR